MPSPAPSTSALPSTLTSPVTPVFRRWAIAVAVYIAAVFNRTSLGVAGLERPAGSGSLLPSSASSSWPSWGFTP